MVTPSSCGTTSIFTSSGSLRRACFTAVTSTSPEPATARTSPLMPLISMAFPAAIAPFQWNSCWAAAWRAVSATPVATVTSTNVKTRIACLLVLFVVTLVVMLHQLPGTAEVDIAVERFELEPGAPRADGEVEPVLALSVELHGEARAEIAVERRDRHRQARLLGDRHPQVAVVCREPIAAAILDGPVVGDIAVDRVGFGVRGLDLHEGDVAVHGFHRDVARDVRRPDLFVDGAQVDTALGLLECHAPLDRLERHVAGSPQDGHVTLDRLGPHLVLRAIHLDVGVHARKAQRHPRGRGDHVVDLRGAAPPAFGLHADDLVGGVDLNAVPARMVRHHADRVPGPRLDRDLPTEIADLEAGARPDGDGRVGLLRGGGRRGGRPSGER